jgi:competence protein ComFB
MEIHNTTEDIVFARLKEICDFFEKQGNADICTCGQCRLDAACYVLNRSEPHYIVSNRGVARVEQESIERQQKTADITALIHEALKRVSHNQRPAPRDSDKESHKVASGVPVFNIPTIVGRLFNGLNFAPMAGINVELYREGKLVPMKDRNWQNPYKLVYNTEGTFAFWPEPVSAESINARATFEYSVKIEAPGLEDLTHFFKIPVISEIQTAGSFSMERTFKLPDLYMFPPGGEEDD